MPFVSNGTLTTDEREIAISETWDTQSEWEAYQSKSGTIIESGVLKLEETAVSRVARWTFDNDDTSGTTAIDVFNDNDGTISGATTGAAGANQTYTTNECYDFDGTDDRVTYPSLPVTNELTVGAWVNIDSIKDQWIISNRGSGDQYTLGFGFGTNSDDITWVVGDGTSTNTAMSANHSTSTWIHAVGVKDPTAGNIRLYIDGSLIDTTSTSFTLDLSNPGSISGSPGGFPLDGRIDDPRVYDKALTDTEVNNWYTSGSI